MVFLNPHPLVPNELELLFRVEGLAKEMLFVLNQQKQYASKLTEAPPAVEAILNEIISHSKRFPLVGKQNIFTCRLEMIKTGTVLLKDVYNALFSPQAEAILVVLKEIYFSLRSRWELRKHIYQHVDDVNFDPLFTACLLLNIPAGYAISCCGPRKFHSADTSACAAESDGETSGVGPGLPVGILDLEKSSTPEDSAASVHLGKRVRSFGSSLPADASPPLGSNSNGSDPTNMESLLTGPLATSPCRGAVHRDTENGETPSKEVGVLPKGPIPTPEKK